MYSVQSKETTLSSFDQTYWTSFWSSALAGQNYEGGSQTSQNGGAVPIIQIDPETEGVKNETNKVLHNQLNSDKSHICMSKGVQIRGFKIVGYWGYESAREGLQWWVQVAHNAAISDEPVIGQWPYCGKVGFLQFHQHLLRFRWSLPIVRGHPVLLSNSIIHRQYGKAEQKP